MRGRRSEGNAVGRDAASSVQDIDVTLSEAKGPKLGFMARSLAVIRSLAGMPDYQAYLMHLRHCHPERPLPTERQFFDEFTRARYGDGPTRCC